MSPDLYPYIMISRIVYGPIRYPAIFYDYIVGIKQYFGLQIPVQVSPAHRIGQTQRLSLTPPQISMSYVVQ